MRGREQSTTTLKKGAIGCIGRNGKSAIRDGIEESMRSGRVLMTNRIRDDEDQTVVK